MFVDNIIMTIVHI